MWWLTVAELAGTVKDLDMSLPLGFTFLLAVQSNLITALLLACKEKIYKNIMLFIDFYIRYSIFHNSINILLHTPGIPLSSASIFACYTKHARPRPRVVADYSKDIRKWVLSRYWLKFGEFRVDAYGSF